MKVKDLNLENIKWNLTKKNIPKKLNISQETFDDFNNRKITPCNINKIIKICVYIKIDNLEKFILDNSLPTDDNYIISDEYKEIIKLPNFMESDSYLENKNSYYMRTQNYKPKYYNLCVKAVEKDMIQWLKWGSVNNYGWFNGSIINHLINISIINNSTKTLIYLSETFDGSYKLDLMSIRYAASYGHLDILRYLIKNKFQYDWKACKYAVEGGHVECLKFLHEIGCKLNDSISTHAIKYGNLECIKYLYQNNCPFVYDSIILAVRYERLSILKYILSNNLFIDRDLAAKILFNNNKKDYEDNYFYPMLILICKESIQVGNLECLKEIYENYNVNLIISSSILQNTRNIKLLQYLHKNNLIKDDGLSYFLSSSCSKDFEFIIYFVDNKLPGYEKFLSNNFVEKIKKRLKWGFNNFEIFLESKHYRNKLNL